MLGIKKRVKRGKGFSPVAAGVITLMILIPAVFFAFTKYNPFYNPYELTAFVQSANNLQHTYSDVRIAGVDVGRVSEVEPLPNGTAKVSMQIEKIGWPIHSDAELHIRPRLFIEGTFFVDIQPGSPSAPLLADGGVIPINQTSTPVQFGQVLTSLQRDTREDLRTLLAEFSINGLKGDGAKGFNRSIPYWEPAYKSTSLANTATLGTEPHDFSEGVMRGQKRVFDALSTDEEALKDLITNFNITANAFAREDAALEDAVVALRDVLVAGPPALRSLNEALPSLRAFARDALPGTRSTPAALDAQIPFLRQARRLVSGPELKGLVADLRQAIPDLARLNRSQIPLLEQQAPFAACNTKVFIPWLETPIPDPDFDELDGSLVREQNQRALTGLAGESRTEDANQEFFRTQPRTGGLAGVTTGENFEGGDLLTSFPDRTGFRPAKPDEGDIPAGRPLIRPEEPCENQEPPDMAAPGEKAGRGNLVDELDLPSVEELLEDPDVQKRAEERLRGLFGQDPDANGFVPFAPDTEN